jgi:magnesium transporter
MTEEHNSAESGATRPDWPVFRDPDENLNPAWIEHLRGHLAEGDGDELAGMMEPLHASDAGDVLEALQADERVALVQMLGDRFDYLALTEVDESIRDDIIDALSTEDMARGVSTLDNDDAVYLLEDMDAEDRDEILAQLPAFERISLKRSLDFPEDSAGRLMQTDFIAIPPFWTVGQTIDRSSSALPHRVPALWPRPLPPPRHSPRRRAAGSSPRRVPALQSD